MSQGMRSGTTVPATKNLLLQKDCSAFHEIRVAEFLPSLGPAVSYLGEQLFSILV